MTTWSKKIKCGQICCPSLFRTRFSFYKFHNQSNNQAKNIYFRTRSDKKCPQFFTKCCRSAFSLNSILKMFAFSKASKLFTLIIYVLIFKLVQVVTCFHSSIICKQKHLNCQFSKFLFLILFLRFIKFWHFRHCS